MEECGEWEHGAPAPLFLETREPARSLAARPLPGRPQRRRLRAARPEGLRGADRGPASVPDAAGLVGARRQRPQGLCAEAEERGSPAGKPRT